MNSMPFGQLKSFLKILIGVQYDTLSHRNDIFPILQPTGHLTGGLYHFISLRQHRTIRQEVSGRIFVPIQSSENGGILYVFPIFGTAEVEQKDG